MVARKRAKRMAPEARREHILDAAVGLILANRHSSCTLEQVAEAAHISKPLIYKYFPNREDLMKAVLERELKELRGRGLDAIPKDMPVERIIRLTVERSLKYYFERGPIIRLLTTDPAVADLVKADNREQRAKTLDYFIARHMKGTGIPRDVAVIAVTMVMNAPIHSISPLKRRGIDANEVIEVWMEFILGGWKALEARYGVSNENENEPIRLVRPRRRTTAI
jgi:TetR/AcrR family transcriptional regulator, fatty acid biosynthesis regulator